ncbi:MAG: nickel-responsive transcriptional regulator NikR [Bacteroidetes bacterium]|nr:nickel-responsive transcriptional regulator NikR [Bacteroidota bacterium]
MKIKRFGVSLDESLVSALDEFVVESKFPNRSQAIRALIKDYLVKDNWDQDKLVAGAVVLVYDHHKRDLNNKLTHVQHDFHHLILSTQHIHLSHHLCLETISIKGKASELKALSDQMVGIKGIHHGKLVMTDLES